MTLLRKAINSLIIKLKEVQKVEPQDIEFELRLLIEETIIECLEENEIVDFCNLRIEDLPEDFFIDNNLNPEILLMMQEEDETFEKIWNQVLFFLKNR